jgi:serine/threonine protein kinase/tetratricopeptide (TPR) repeat protein
LRGVSHNQKDIESSMNIDDLSAKDLARIDAICLQYETDLRENRAPAIDSIVQHAGGAHREILRTELNAVKFEVENAQVTDTLADAPVRAPFQIPPLEQPDSADSTADADSSHSPSLQLSPLQQPSLAKTNAAIAGSSTPESQSAKKRVLAKLRLPKPGDQIGPYVLGGPIGHGGMGTVFRAMDTRLDREVAIKVLSVGGEKRQELSDRFEREAKAVAALSHTNIVELFDVGVVNDLPFAVMEMLRGETLDGRLEHGRLSAAEVRFLGVQIADALAVAHQAGVVHRDLKPQNIMILGQRSSQQSDSSKQPNNSPNKIQDNQSTLTPSRFELATAKSESSFGRESRVKVFDFGLSRVSMETEQDSSMETKAGAIMGTPGYMSPEQVRGEQATAAADIFALGCVLYRSFYGEDPIRGATAAERFAATLAPPPTPSPEIVSEDKPLADLIDRCLSQSIADRPASATEIADSLRLTQSIDPVIASLNAGYNSGEIFRRRFLGSLCGGFVGALTGHLSMPDDISKLSDVKRLAVLSLDTAPIDSSVKGQPLGTRALSPGEKLSALLVNELSQLPDVAVPPYRALSANSPEEFQDLANELNVDAFVTGSITPQRIGKKDFLNVDLRIVSSNGDQLWGHAGREEVGDNLLQQSQFATDIANKINRRLTATMQQSQAPPPMLYQCLIDGKVRSDPDSTEGMQMALNCLKKAKKVDDSYVQPIAGIALVSMMLAAQSDAEETKTLVADAIEALQEIAEREQSSVDAKLAAAMIDWQRFGRFDDAETKLESLAMLHPYHWQVQHQYGLLLLATGRQAKSLRVLGDASRLNTLSMLVRSDVARAAWFNGNPQRAITDAKEMLKRYPDGMPELDFARGLLIDIYEHQEDYVNAVKTDKDFGETTILTAELYFARRLERLKVLPYGPFGEIMNEAILTMRSTGQATDGKLSELIESSSPNFPLLLAVHPAFGRLRQLERAKEWII